MSDTPLGTLTIIPDHAAEEMRRISSTARTAATTLTGRSAAPHLISGARQKLLVVAERSLALYFETAAIEP